MAREKILAELQLLANHSALLGSFIGTMEAISEVEASFLAESIDGSDYSVQDWLLALHEFHLLQRHSQTAHSLQFQIEYLNCCVQGSIQGGGKLIPLPEVFREYASLYGIKGGI